MIHDEDLKGHKIWRLIYVVLLILNFVYSPSYIGAIWTGVLTTLILFLLWGQQLAINDIHTRKKD